MSTRRTASDARAASDPAAASGAPGVDLSERSVSLWALVASPALWAAHFMLSYITAAIWCAKASGPEQSLASVRVAIAAYTLAALAGIAVVGWRGWKRQSIGSSSAPHDADTPEDRQRFVGLATLLLSGLSAVAVLYAALAAAFIGSCR
jgi:hypothetical protein